MNVVVFFVKKKGDSRITEIFEKSIFATKKKKPEIMYFPCVILVGL